MPDLVVLFEHPEWQRPLLQTLKRRNLDFDALDLKSGAFDVDAVPSAPLYFNQASPSAYTRGNARALPFALSLIRSLEARGARVLNGSKVFSIELSKSLQATILQSLGIDHPRSLAFNDVESALSRWDTWPALLKPEQGGSGARMFEITSPDDLRRLLSQQPELWLPDNLLLLQEKFEIAPRRGIVRLEFIGQELLYAMRVVSHGSFNLCPTETCNPIDRAANAKGVEFFAYPEVPDAAVRKGQRIMQATGLDIGGIEYLEAPDGRLIFFDINANSNLRPAIAEQFGFNPFERVAEFLEQQLAIVQNSGDRPHSPEARGKEPVLARA